MNGQEQAETDGQRPRQGAKKEGRINMRHLWIGHLRAIPLLKEMCSRILLLVHILRLLAKCAIAMQILGASDPILKRLRSPELLIDSFKL